jgi:RND family efflux transporter MFP subunit
MKLPIPAFVRRHPWRYGIILVVLLAIVGGSMAMGGPAQPEYVTETSKKADLVQTVEAVGTLISEHDLKLQFPMSGIIAAINVKEGQKVRAGQVLASIRGGNYAADVAAASAQVRSAEAQLQALLEGARVEDIAITEADVANKQSALNTAKSNLENAKTALTSAESQLTALKSEALTGLAGNVATAKSTASQELVDAENALQTITDIFNNNDIQDAVIKGNPSGLNDVTMAQQRTITDLRAINSRVTAVQDFEAALALMESVRISMQNAARVMDQAYSVISGLQTTSNFTPSAQEAYKSTVATQRSSLQGSLSSVESAANNLRDAAASYTTRIAAQEAAVTSAKSTIDRSNADILTYQTSLQIAQAQLQLKKAPPRQADIDAQQAVVRQMRASLARASANYGNTLLTAPIAGTVTKVNLKLGEATPVGAAVEMLGDSPFRIEMYASEIDIPKVQLSQSGSIELDAYRGTHFKLRVSEMDRSATDKDGVSKYRVKLDFEYPHPELKIGMTGDAEIITGQRNAVIVVPRRSVLENDEGNYVRIVKADGTVEERPVTMGMEGSTGDVEIVSGVQEGETVVVLEKK